MTQINRTTLKAIRADLDAALLAVAKKHGILFSLGAIKFSDTEAHGTLRMTATDGDVAEALAETDGSVSQRNLIAEQAYKAQAQAFNLSPDWLGRSFKMNGSEFTVVGLLPNKHKNNVLIRRVSTGKQFICPPQALHNGFA